MTNKINLRSARCFFDTWIYNDWQWQFPKNNEIKLQVKIKRYILPIIVICHTCFKFSDMLQYKNIAMFNDVNRVIEFIYLLLSQV